MNNNLMTISRTFFKTMAVPLLFLASIYSLFFIYQWVTPIYFSKYTNYFPIAKLVFDASIIIGTFWLLRNSMNIASVFLMRWATEKNNPLLSSVCPALMTSLKDISLFIMLNMIVLLLDAEGTLGFLLSKGLKIFLIWIIASILYKIINNLEIFIISNYIEQNPNTKTSRKIRTQVVLLKKILVFLLVAFSLISITMLFDSIKNFGLSLLTTAGIVSAVAAFASQQSLARLFAGLQLAFTQPLRIGDTVIIDNEFGQVEEISLSFITIKLWDLRRLILPADYFTNKGLVNLTRESSELLGTVFLYTDYTLPIDKVRDEFHRILQFSTFWNKKSSSLEITDIKPNAMEIRCLVSADDANTLWKLRCDVREKLISYIVAHYPNCLVKSRNLSLAPQTLSEIKETVAG